MAPGETRLLLVDGHDSHKTLQFTTIAEEYDIVLYAFPPHATHLLQPLDVKVFQQCKHFHQRAIDESIRSFDFEYKLRTFLGDLPEIRRQSLTIRTILAGWRDAGLWPYNPALVIDKLQNTITPKTQKLTCLEESVVIQHILDLDSRRFSPRLRAVEDMANQLLASQDAGKVGLN
jgi:hypothetical protein